MYTRNCWYVVAWDYELGPEQIISRRIMDEQIVLYRNTAGNVVALEDRCSHRFAPLSSGRIEGDDIRCMYHGMKFCQTGRCVEIPGQAVIPERASVRAYPVQERDNWIWLWMGSPAAADADLVPQAVGLDHPDFRMKSGQMDIEASYQLINDNLCDLSHLAYVHPETLGRGAPSWADSVPVTTRLPRGIRSQRWLPGTRRDFPDGSSDWVDQWNAYDFLVPGVFLLLNSSYPAGTAKRLDYQPPPADLKPLSSLFSTQAVTPVSERLTRYFYSIGPRTEGATAESVDLLFSVAQSAFEEDRIIETAQQKILDMSEDKKMLTISTDTALLMFRKVMSEIAKEALVS